MSPQADDEPCLPIDEPVDDDFPADQTWEWLSRQRQAGENAAHRVGHRDARGSWGQEHSIFVGVLGGNQRIVLEHHGRDRGTDGCASLGRCDRGESSPPWSCHAHSVGNPPRFLTRFRPVHRPTTLMVVGSGARRSVVQHPVDACARSEPSSRPYEQGSFWVR